MILYNTITTFNFLTSPAMGEIAADPVFIQELEHRPKLAITEAENIPIIDLSPLSSPNDRTNPTTIEALVAEIREASKNWGFFQVINHGVSLEKREKIFLVAKKLFALSIEEKRKVRRSEKNPSGYYDTEHTKNVRDWKEIFDFQVEDPTWMPASPDPDDQELTTYVNQWPEHLPELRETSEEYVDEMQKLAYKLLGLIALSLGLPEDRLRGFFKSQTSRVRFNRYPPCPIPDLALGVGRHKDGVALTILAQDEVGGLQVRRKTDGEWILVKPAPNAYIVNIGDITQVWSNDRYESVEHRAMVNNERERFSIPFFYGPSHDTSVEPLEELTDEQNPAKYRAYNWGKFLAHRKLSNFKKLNVENIQIHHFKISE